MDTVPSSLCRLTLCSPCTMTSILKSSPKAIDTSHNFWPDILSSFGVVYIVLPKYIIMRSLTDLFDYTRSTASMNVSVSFSSSFPRSSGYFQFRRSYFRHIGGHPDVYSGSPDWSNTRPPTVPGLTNTATYFSTFSCWVFCTLLFLPSRSSIRWSTISSHMTPFSEAH